MASARRAAALLCAALGMVGCARNAILEIELTVPPLPAGAGERYAVVQVETGDVTFDEEWERTVEYPGTPLTSEAQAVRYSVVAGEEHPVVLVKVLFCTTPDCTAIDDASDRVPAVWYELEQPLYVGERTWFRRTIATLPTDPTTGPTIVGKCDIEGCIASGSTETTYCRLSGQHYCE